MILCSITHCTQHTFITASIAAASDFTFLS